MNVKLNYFSAFSFLRPFIEKYKKHFIVFRLGWLVDCIFQVVNPILLGIMVDEIVYYQNMHTFLWIAFVFFTCIVFSGILYFFIYAQHAYLMSMFVFSIRKKLFLHLQKCDASFLDTEPAGNILNVLQDYPEECMHFVIRNVIHFTNGILLLVLYAGYLLHADWRIGSISVIAAVLAMVISIKFSGKIRALGGKEREYSDKNVSWIYEIAKSLRDIKILGVFDKVTERFETNQKNLFDVNVKKELLSLHAENAVKLVNLGIQLLVYGIAAFLSVQGEITVGMLIVIFAFYDKLASKVHEIGRSYLDAQNRISYIKKIRDFLQVKEEPDGAQRLVVKNGEILFRNITFGYDNQKKVLNKVCWNIKAGDHVALVGVSGSGKTTLAHLLLRFYQPSDGNIVIDGVDITECSLESIRKNIGIVQQDTLIFDGTIRQNLLLGNIHANTEQMIEACQLAQIRDFIENLPDGLDTVLGSHGIEVSGGQKQRLAIARIYLKNPSIIIFDEATSALDGETEEVIHEAWKQVLKGKTALVIAHRLRSVMLCDRVAILDNGRIVEEGETEELVKNSERFRGLFAVSQGE
ncbi:MAG: ABC transporter ATP-binding protein [Lachnospiraceae bacterium]|nr:ABC transporter ATP-binding protein [Lachnospiraceae bacterium]